MVEPVGVRASLRALAVALKGVLTTEYVATIGGGFVGGGISAFTAEALRAVTGVTGTAATAVRVFTKFLLSVLFLAISLGRVGLWKLFTLGMSVGSGISMVSDIIEALIGTTPEAEGWKLGMTIKALVAGTAPATYTPPQKITAGKPKQIQIGAPEARSVW